MYRDTKLNFIMSIYSLLLAQTFSSGEDIFLLILLLLFLLFLGLFIWSLIWLYKDAENRGKSGCLVIFLVLMCSWPVSILLWIVSRPD